MTYVAKPVATLLDPKNCVAMMIDYHPQMAYGVTSIDGQTLMNNAVGFAKSAKVFNIPTIFTSVSEKSFSGPMFKQIRDVFPRYESFDRTTMNAWEDARVVDTIKRTGRKKIVMCGLFTEVCVAYPALDALREGYEVYIVADACGGTTPQAHDFALQRCIQAGATPLTWLQFLFEMQRDCARHETYDAVLDIVQQYGGSYGFGVQYAKAMFGERTGQPMK